MIRLTAHITGRARWTGYEAKVIALAKEIGLVGIIQNRPNDRVLVIAEGGKKDDLERFASAIWIREGITDVENIEVEYTGAPGAYSGLYSDFRKVTGPDEIGERLDEGIIILNCSVPLRLCGEHPSDLNHRAPRNPHKAPANPSLRLSVESPPTKSAPRLRAIDQ